MAKLDIHGVSNKEATELASQGILSKEGLQVIEVTLSERNLLSLFTKLFIPTSKRTIYKDDVQEGHVLKLVSEDDESHYINRDPGTMHPDTEELVGVIRQAIRQWEENKKVVTLFNKSVVEARGEDPAV